MDLYLGHSRHQWLDHFQERMERAEPGSSEKKRLQIIVAYLSNKIRGNEKLQIEAEQIPQSEPVEVPKKNLFRYARENLKYERNFSSS